MPKPPSKESHLLQGLIMVTGIIALSFAVLVLGYSLNGLPVYQGF